MRTILTFACLLLAALPASAANFPYIRLNGKTNVVSDNGTNLTYNGSAIGGGSVTYPSITNAMSWSGDTNNVIGGDGRERTVSSGGQPASATLTNLSNGIGTDLTNLLAAAVQAAQTNVVTTNFVAKTGDTMTGTLNAPNIVVTNSLNIGGSGIHVTSLEAGYFPIDASIGWIQPRMAWNGGFEWNFATSAGNTNQVARATLSALGHLSLNHGLSLNNDLTVVNDNFWSFGAPSANRFRYIYVATAFIGPSLQVGGTTAGFPMLTNSSTSLKVRLADDSGDTDIISYGANMREGKLATVTGINVNTNTLQTLYVVPAGKTLIVTKIVLRNASTSLTTASFGIGYDSPAANVVTSATHTTLTNNTLYEIVPAKAGAIKGNAADTLSLSCTINQGAAATVDVDVFGFFL